MFPVGVCSAAQSGLSSLGQGGFLLREGPPRHRSSVDSVHWAVAPGPVACPRLHLDPGAVHFTWVEAGWGGLLPVPAQGKGGTGAWSCSHRLPSTRPRPGEGRPGSSADSHAELAAVGCRPCPPSQSLPERKQANQLSPSRQAVRQEALCLEAAGSRHTGWQCCWQKADPWGPGRATGNQGLGLSRASAGEGLGAGTGRAGHRTAGREAPGLPSALCLLRPTDARAWCVSTWCPLSAG